jgi:hypothetical protein
MNHVMKIGFGVAVSFMMLASAAQADDFKLSNNQRIACSRGLAPGKLNTATCKSYAYVFNVKTSEYFRCQVSLALTRDNKEVITVQADGGCTKKPRIFDADSDYSFDATETEGPSTNSFFGPGGYAVWASDNKAPKVRGCITISSGLGSDISKCIDMSSSRSRPGRSDFFAGAGCQLRARPGELSDPLRLAEQIALGKGAGAVVVGQLDDPADD